MRNQIEQKTVTHKIITLFSSIIISSTLLNHSAHAQSDDEKQEEMETIEKRVEGFEAIDGFFKIYRDPQNGEVFLEVSETQLGQEFMAFTYFEDGLTQTGTFRGSYGATQILEPRRYFDRIEFLEKSTAFYFNPDSPLAKAKRANVPESIMATLSIEAQTLSDDPDIAGRYLISGEELFLSETLQQLIPSPNPEAPPNAFSVGNLSSDKTRYSDIRNYPENTDLIINYVFDNPYPVNQGGDSVTDAHSVSYQVRHTLLKMPEEEFVPRFDDYRIGYFFDRVTDLTSPENANYRDLIKRWRLVKKDPSAALSDPVEPITWWMENTTPLEYRETIADAVLAWNQAFEKAGFKNAIVVKMQPDDATWDAGDIRYNVLRWTSSPTPPFGGYGPSFSNPRTGEILGADIMLEYVFITNRLNISEIFDVNASSTTLPNTTVAQHPLLQEDKSLICSAGHHLQLSTLFARTALLAQDKGEASANQLIKESLYYLILHEVGHTLGLNHNMKASIQYSPDEVHNIAMTNGAPTGSVMDYPAINIAPTGRPQGDYYMQRPGPYDDWAIEFGYTPKFDAVERRKLLSRAGEKGLAFGNDADDMRSPGRGIDPRININDMSSDPVQYAIERIGLTKEIIPKLADKFDDRNSWQDLVSAYLITTGQHAAMAQIISRQIGGVHVERRAPKTQSISETKDGNSAPYRPVSRALQKKAMRALAQYVYARDAFSIPPALAARLQPQRRGFDFGEDTEDPKIHERVLDVQISTLEHVLHPKVLRRMTDSTLYGGRYEPEEMILDLNQAIFGNDLKANPNGFRRNLQIAYLNKLTNMIDHPDYSASARSAALAAIEDIRRRFGFFDFNLTPRSKAHRLQIKRIIESIDG